MVDRLHRKHGKQDQRVKTREIKKVMKDHRNNREQAKITKMGFQHKVRITIQ